ncbi:hypothetical protein LXA43DRAFT_1099223 [Ganoderma leucocontextum]|nr:hypothetical protein LXA43DRAFT_1099223 [Ganoderma leucocontextum]
MPIAREPDDEPVAYQALAFPIVGEAAVHRTLALLIVGEADESSTSPTSSYGAEGWRMDCEEPPAPPVPILREDADSPASILALPAGKGASSSTASSNGGRVSEVEGTGGAEDGDASLASYFTLPIVGEAEDDCATSMSYSPGSYHSDIEDRHSLPSPTVIRASSLEVTPSPCMFDDVLPGMTIVIPTEEGTTSPPLSTYSGGSEQPMSPAFSNVETQTFVHQRLAHLHSKHETISATIEALQEAELTARALQDCPFSTSPQYWRAFVIGATTTTNQFLGGLEDPATGYEEIVYTNNPTSFVQGFWVFDLGALTPVTAIYPLLLVVVVALNKSHCESRFECEHGREGFKRIRISDVPHTAGGNGEAHSPTQWRRKFLLASPEPAALAERRSSRAGVEVFALQKRSEGEVQE